MTYRLAAAVLCLVACQSPSTASHAPTAPDPRDPRELDEYVNRVSEARSHGQTAEVLRWAEMGLLSEPARRAPFDRRVMVLLDMKAHALWSMSRPLDARAFWEDAETRCTRAGTCERRLLGDIELGLGRVHYNLTDYSRALTYYSSALQHLDPSHDRDPIAATLQELGHTLVQLGRALEAYAYLERAIQLETELGPTHELKLAMAHTSLANARASGKDNAGAEAHFQRAIEILARHEPEGDATRMDTLLSLGRIRRDLHRTAEAVPLLEEAEALLRRNPSLEGKRWELIAQRIDVTEELHGTAAANELRNQLGVVTVERQIHAPLAATTPTQWSSGGTVRNASHTVAKMRSQFRACYNAELAVQRDAGGSVRTRMDVDAGGSVWRVRVDRLGNVSGTMLNCVIDVCSRGAFDPPAGGKAVVVVPITFVRTDVKPGVPRPNTP